MKDLYIQKDLSTEKTLQIYERETGFIKKDFITFEKYNTCFAFSKNTFKEVEYNKIKYLVIENYLPKIQDSVKKFEILDDKLVEEKIKIWNIKDMNKERKIDKLNKLEYDIKLAKYEEASSETIAIFKSLFSQEIEKAYNDIQNAAINAEKQRKEQEKQEQLEEIARLEKLAELRKKGK